MSQCRKWHHPHFRLVPYKLSPRCSSVWVLLEKRRSNYGTEEANINRKWHRSPWSQSPGRRRRSPRMEEVKKESDRNREWKDGRSLGGDARCCVNICSPVDMCYLQTSTLETLQNCEDSWRRWFVLQTVARPLTVAMLLMLCLLSRSRFGLTMFLSAVKWCINLNIIDGLKC